MQAQRIVERAPLSLYRHCFSFLHSSSLTFANHVVSVAAAKCRAFSIGTGVATWPRLGHLPTVLGLWKGTFPRVDQRPLPTDCINYSWCKAPRTQSISSCSRIPVSLGWLICRSTFVPGLHMRFLMLLKSDYMNQ